MPVFLGLRSEGQTGLEPPLQADVVRDHLWKLMSLLLHIPSRLPFTPTLEITLQCAVSAISAFSTSKRSVCESVTFDAVMTRSNLLLEDQTIRYLTTAGKRAFSKCRRRSQLASATCLYTLPRDGTHSDCDILSAPGRLRMLRQGYYCDCEKSCCRLPQLKECRIVSTALTFLGCAPVI